MAGGDLGSAISRDVAEHGTGPQRRLGWYCRGRTVLLWVARGLAYLHRRRVREAHLGWAQNDMYKCMCMNIMIFDMAEAVNLDTGKPESEW